MKLLLDTHAWIWFTAGDSQLSQIAKDSIEDAGNETLVSPASYWELAIKLSTGKIQISRPYLEFVEHAIAGNGFQTLNVLPQHTEKVAALPFLRSGHRDPFDRLLVAQALVENVVLVSTMNRCWTSMAFNDCGNRG